MASMGPSPIKPLPPFAFMVELFRVAWPRERAVSCTHCGHGAGDGAFGISMNEMSAIGRNEWPPITMIIFRNYQWGAEKRNTTLWFDDNFVGTELDQQVSYAGVAKACGVEGVAVSTMDELRDSLAKAVDAQMNDGVTTFIEVLLNQELGEPFRRDAMKQPVSVAGISQADMRPQQSA